MNANKLPFEPGLPGSGAAVLDAAHTGDIRGAFGTIKQGDTDARKTFGHRLRTLLAVLGPGLIVMVGDNDAGAFGTYTQAGQNYGTSLLWTLLLLIPVLFVNQEMVLHLGAVTGVGHARLIFERFGKFWGAFSVIDLFVLNALTIVTEFIGISLGLDYLDVSKFWGVIASALLIVGSVSTGDFRRFERISMLLVFGSLLLVPVFLMIHPPLAQIAHDSLVPHMPAGSKLSEVLLLIIAIVGTTVAPWQLFFQQSYVIDKRITPRFMRYERVDLWIGIGMVILGAIAMMSFAATTFVGTTEFGNFTDAAAVAQGMEAHFGRLPAVLFGIALIDASIIGACAVSLSTAYAIGDVFAVRHSLHRKPGGAKAFYAVYAGLIFVAVVLVLTPGTPLGLLTNLVQSLAGVLLPSAAVFLLLLCNDQAVLGPWVNSRRLNIFTAGVIAVLVMLSVILMASVLFPSITEVQILAVLIGGSVLAVVTAVGVKLYERSRGIAALARAAVDRESRASWRMPPIGSLPPAQLTLLNKVWMLVLRAYLLVAAGLLLARLGQLALTGA